MSIHDTLLAAHEKPRWDGTMNEAGMDIVKTFEGWSSSVYQCSAGRWTVGWGSTWDHRGNPITSEQSDITEEYGTTLLRREVSHVEKAIRRLISAELTENMFSALCSFTYNVGTGNLQRSTLRMKLNRGQYEDAADEFPKWRRAGGRVLRGLVRRRKREKELFLT